MSIRSIILFVSIPLLILLAAVNGALLYFQGKAEMLHGLNDRALAAAITGAEFLAAGERPETIASDPLRRRAMTAAARHIDGLDGYYLIGGDAKPVALVPSATPWAIPAWSAPAEPVVLPVARAANGRRHVVALAPVSPGRFVAARVDAEPVFARIDGLLHWIELGIALAALIGLAAGWYVARRITRELDASARTMRALETGASPGNDEALSIAEARDLSAALRLIDANRTAARDRLERQLRHEDAARTPSEAWRAWRQSRFAPIATTVAGSDVAVRLLGDAPPGCFFALCQGQGEAALVMGECEASTATDALALAIAARGFFERQLLVLGADAALELACPAYTIARVEHLVWGEASPPSAVRLLALADPEVAQRAQDYAAIDPAAAPSAVLDAMDGLLKPDGLFAAVRRG